MILLLLSSASFFCFFSAPSFFLHLVLCSSSSFNGRFFRNPSLLGDSLPPFDISTRLRRLETVLSRFISNVGLSQILFCSLVAHSDHSGILVVFTVSWYYPWFSIRASRFGSAVIKKIWRTNRYLPNIILSPWNRPGHKFRSSSKKN